MRRGTEMTPEQRAAVINGIENKRIEEAMKDLRAPGEVAAEKEAAERAKEKKDFLQRFKELAGDPAADFSEDTELYLDVGDSYLP